MDSSTRRTKRPALHPRPAPARRDFRGMELRRRRAAALFAEGISQAEVARRLKVSAQSVSRWYRRWRHDGDEGLRRAERAGRPPLLTAFQLAAVEAMLLQGAVANGYPTELWTLRRVAEVIARLTGVEYHPGHVWKVLRGMGWSRQKPARRAVERDQEKVDAWVKERWPALKRGLAATTPGSSSRTRAASP